jgi:diguanylate cyclase (GGDEF)-like protein
MGLNFRASTIQFARPWVRLRQGLKGLRQRLRHCPRKLLYPWVGALLAQGAPLGLLLTRAYEDQSSTSLLDALALLEPSRSGWLLQELGNDRNAYLYLILSSTSLLMLLGFLLGMQEDRLRLLATTDALTGLMNRRHFTVNLRQELERAKRYKTPLSLLVIDLDWLKAINDGHGHSAGDRAIAAVASTLHDGLRSTDFSARYAGDEFAALLPETTAQEALGLARRVSLKVAQLALGPQGASLSVSIGVADLASCGAPTAEDLFMAADDALYRAKAAGRNHVVAADAAPHALFDTDDALSQQAPPSVRGSHGRSAGASP